MGIREDAFEGKPLNCKIIDAHTHIGICNSAGLYQGFVSEKEIKRLNKQYGGK